MGVYFPDMKFPQNCGDCDLLYDCCACGVTHKRMDFETMDRERHPNCPPWRSCRMGGLLMWT